MNSPCAAQRPACCRRRCSSARARVAAQGDAAAQGETLFQEGQRLYGQQRFSEAFEFGRGVAQDRSEAIRLYRLAAAQGHPLA